MTPSPISVWWKLPLVVVIGGWILWWLAGRTTSDRRVGRAILVSYLVRVLMAVTLYAISYWHWPILSSLHFHDGFWAFGPDAWDYHHFAPRILHAWEVGEPVPHPGMRIEYYLVVAAVYKLCGYHPLYPILLNCGAASLSGLLAYLIARRLFDQRAALLSAILVLFWPSSILWSTQLLKDALCWLLAFVILALLLEAVTMCKEETRVKAVRWGLLCTAIASTVMALTLLRYYLGLIFAATAVVTCGVAASWAMVRQQIRRAVLYAWLSLVVLISALTMQTTALFGLTITPTLPEEQAEAMSGAVLPMTPAPVLQEYAAVRDSPRSQSQSSSILSQRAHQLSLLDDRILFLARGGGMPVLHSLRNGFLSSGGRTLMDTKVKVSTPPQLLAYLPKAIAIGFLAPFPWQWFDTAGSTGFMRVFAGVEMFLVYGLLPGMLVGLWRLIKRRTVESLMVPVFILCTAIPMALVVANMGILFRLRLHFLLPLLLVASGGLPLGIVQRWTGRMGALTWLSGASKGQAEHAE